MFAIFLDRDGVINNQPEDGFVIKAEQVKILPGAAEAIKELNKIAQVIVVTNQPCVARNLCTEDEVLNVNKFIKTELEDKGAKIDAFYYCPHHPEFGHAEADDPKYRRDCNCRKPEIGMLENAAKDFSLNLRHSFFVGDSTRDIKCGENAGCTTLLVKTGYAGKDGKYEAKPDFVCKDLRSAAEQIKQTIKNGSVGAVILAGGRGERMRPLTDKMPKPLLPIGGKPILEHQIRLLKKYGIRDIVVCGHYMIEKMKDYFGSGEEFGVNISYPKEENPLGTAGTIKNAEEFIKKEDFFIFSGDIMIEMGLQEIIDFHKKNKGIATMILRESDHPYDVNIFEMEGTRITKMIGKPKHGEAFENIAHTGLEIVNRRILNYMEKKYSKVEDDVIKHIIGKEKVLGFFVKPEYNFFIKDIGTIERYEEVRRRFEK